MSKPPIHKKSTGVMPLPPKLHNFLSNRCGSFFHDSQGQIVFAQKANLPLKLWFITQTGAIITWFIFKFLHNYFVVAALISIAWWAIWEIVDGVCPWRRFLGFIVYNIALIVALRFFEVI